MTPPIVPEYHSGTGKVIRPGDTVRIGNQGHTYTVKKLTAGPQGLEVHCYGGPPNRERFRTVLVDRVSRVVSPKHQRVPTALNDSMKPAARRTRR